MVYRKLQLLGLVAFLVLLPNLAGPHISTVAQSQKARRGSTTINQTLTSTCPVCNGTGKTHEHVVNNQEVRCSRCAGKGETLCEGIVGWPHSDDYYPNGKRMICWKCNGNGRVRCPVCDGSGTQTVDKGYDLTKVCYSCKGSGRAAIGMKLVLIPSGSFMMGGDKNSNEQPRRKVFIPTPFYIGMYEVTQAQWKFVMGSNPNEFKGDNLPVENVSWYDAQAFCRKLSELTGKEYRLPSEAEWEYAARASSSGDYCFGNDAKLLPEYAWFDANSGSKTHPVGQKKPNAWGLYDVHGNVWEWCEDVWHDNYQGAPDDGSAWMTGEYPYRLVRGGSWYHDHDFARAVYRNHLSPDDRSYIFGFRVVGVVRPPSR